MNENLKLILSDHKTNWIRIFESLFNPVRVSGIIRWTGWFWLTRLGKVDSGWFVTRWADRYNRVDPSETCTASKPFPGLGCECQRYLRWLKTRSAQAWWTWTGRIWPASISTRWTWAWGLRSNSSRNMTVNFYSVFRTTTVSLKLFRTFTTWIQCGHRPWMSKIQN